MPKAGESGLPVFEFNSCFAMLAQKGTPSEITHRLAQQVEKALEDPR